MNVLHYFNKKGVHDKMAHVRKNCSKPSHTVSFDPKVLEIAKDYFHSEGKDNFSQSVNELIILGKKYKDLVERHKAKKREKVPV